MANISVPHVLAGTIDAQKFDDNFEAIKTGLTDGTKDINMLTTTVGDTLTPTVSFSVAGDCTTEGEPHFEQVALPLVRCEDVANIYDGPFGGGGGTHGYLGSNVSDAAAGWILHRTAVAVGLAVRCDVGLTSWTLTYNAMGLTATVNQTSNTTYASVSYASATSYPPGTKIFTFVNAVDLSSFGTFDTDSSVVLLLRFS